LISCNSEKIELQENSKSTFRTSNYNRLDYLQSFTNWQEMQQHYVSQLTDADRQTIWLDKIDQIKTQNLTEQQALLVDNIYRQISEVETFTPMEIFSNAALIQTFTDLAKVTPASEFKNMLYTFEDYRMNPEANDAPCESCISEFANELSNLKLTSAAKIPDWQHVMCNCQWGFCDFGGVGICSEVDCTPTIGCGLVWLGTCYKRCVL
jgi:hypothetical protein